MSMFQGQSGNSNKIAEDMKDVLPGVEKKDKASKRKQSFEVHAMPSKFHLTKTSSGHSGSSGNFETPKGKKKDFGKIVLIVVAAVIVIGLGVIGFLIYQRSSETANTNTNANANLNTNVVINSSLNINTNRNTNTANTNANSNTNATNTNTTNTNTQINTATLFELQSSEDLDDDGLTDVEEDVLGTSKTTADSDGDSFADGTEVLFGYSPNNKGKLEDDRKLSLHTNNTYGFTYLYPTDWTLQLVGNNERGVYLFPEDSDEFVEVSVQDNVGRLTPKEWYMKEVPTAQASAIIDIENWEEDAVGVQSVDGYSIHYGSGNYIYTFYYNTGNKTKVDFKAFFEMIYKSVSFFTPVPNTNTNSNANENLNTNSGSGVNSTITIPLNSNTNTNTNSNTNSNTNTNVNTNTNGNSNTNA